MLGNILSRDWNAALINSNGVQVAQEFLCTARPWANGPVVTALRFLPVPSTIPARGGIKMMENHNRAWSSGRFSLIPWSPIPNFI